MTSRDRRRVLELERDRLQALADRSGTTKAAALTLAAAFLEQQLDRHPNPPAERSE